MKVFLTNLTLIVIKAWLQYDAANAIRTKIANSSS